MTLEPFVNNTLIVQIHIFAALLALLLGPIAIYLRRRDGVHRAVGGLWVTAMAVTALSSFGITSFAVLGPFSPIHALALLALWSLWHGLRAIAEGRIRAHQEAMTSLYWNGLMIAGAFQFLPGRSTNRVFFADHPEAGYIVLALVLAALAARLVHARRVTVVSSA